MSALPTAVPIVLADSSAACSPRLGFPPVPAHAMSIRKSKTKVSLYQLAGCLLYKVTDSAGKQAGAC